ncbi:DUF1049 domain-containing protein [Pseudomonas putida]|uniref:DUF1049 domain-containing protein n=1 Tax=Pseudomonas putida TaxID=303 RepID=UPI002363FCC1|nr:DUF1049 domain-containing protein [Pseudomonas putida]MDD2101057.1 DUF1049 domain-containing protein [Pseudomonas putida]
MNSVKRATMFAVLILFTALVVVFILENNQPASLVFFGWSAPQLPIAAYVIIALLLGWCAGPLLILGIRSKVSRRRSHPE